MSSNDFAPGLLLAAPRLGDPNFERTVVLVGRHTDEGSLGWVLNGRSLGRVRDLLAQARMDPSAHALPMSEAFDAEARVGGPVSSNSGWLLYHRAEADGTDRLGEFAIDSLGVSGDPEVFKSVLRGGPPRAFRLLLGYAGWGPGQLEREVMEGAWLPAPLYADLVMGGAHDDLWDAAYRRAIGSPPGAFLSTQRGSA